LRLDQKLSEFCSYFDHLQFKQISEFDIQVLLKLWPSLNNFCLGFIQYTLDLKILYPTYDSHHRFFKDNDLNNFGVLYSISRVKHFFLFQVPFNLWKFWVDFFLFYNKYYNSDCFSFKLAFPRNLNINSYLLKAVGHDSVLFWI